MRASNIERFSPVEHEYWRLIATGHAPVPAGRRKHAPWRASVDPDGFGIRNGGIAMAREWDMPAGQIYYRFADTARYSNDALGGPMSAAIFGYWWVEAEVAKKMVSFARAHGYPLETVASYFLALPKEWGDRGRLIRACLKYPLRAWRGRGLPASEKSGKYIPPEHLGDVFQLFIPGDASQKAAAFLPVHRKRDVIYTRSFEDSSWFT